MSSLFNAIYGYIYGTSADTNVASSAAATTAVVAAAGAPAPSASAAAPATTAVTARGVTQDVYAQLQLRARACGLSDADLQRLINHAARGADEQDTVIFTRHDGAQFAMTATQKFALDKLLEQERAPRGNTIDSLLMSIDQNVRSEKGPKTWQTNFSWLSYLTPIGSQCSITAIDDSGEYLSQSMRVATGVNVLGNEGRNGGAFKPGNI